MPRNITKEKGMLPKSNFSWTTEKRYATCALAARERSSACMKGSRVDHSISTVLNCADENEVARLPTETENSVMPDTTDQCTWHKPSLLIRFECNATSQHSNGSYCRTKSSADVILVEVHDASSAEQHVPLLRLRGTGVDCEADSSPCSIDTKEGARNRESVQVGDQRNNDQTTVGSTQTSKHPDCSEIDHKLPKAMISKPAPRDTVTQLHNETQNDDDTTRAEFLRKRNAFYSRRKYARKKIEIEVLKEQCREAKKKNDTLVTEEERLKSLLTMAKEVVNIHTTRGPEALLARSPNSSALPLIVNSVGNNELSRPTHQAYHESNIALMSALGRQQLVPQGLLTSQPSLQTSFGTESLLGSITPRLSDAAFFGGIPADPRTASAQPSNSLFLGTSPSYILDSRAVLPAPGSSILLGERNWNIDPSLRTQQLQYIAVPRDAMRTGQIGDSGLLGNLGLLMAQQAPLPPNVAYDPSSLIRQDEAQQAMQANRLQQRSRSEGKAQELSTRPLDVREGISISATRKGDQGEAPQHRTGPAIQREHAFGVTDQHGRRIHPEPANSAGLSQRWQSSSTSFGGSFPAESLMGSLHSPSRAPGRFHRSEHWSENKSAVPSSNSRRHVQAHAVDSEDCSSTSDESQPSLKRKRNE